MMSAAALEQRTSAGRGGARSIAEDEASSVRATLLAMARALRFGSKVGLCLPIPAASAAGAQTDEESSSARSNVQSDAEATTPAASRQIGGPEWLSHHFAGQVQRLCALLAQTEPQWNIERRVSAATRREHDSAA
jgi:hypothetical protein